ncbi:hypothetical protein BRC87_04420, partial [Halobacteriales archaeon QS_4_66_20]
GGEIEETVDVRAYPNEPPDASLSVETGDRGLDEYHIVGEQLTFDASNSTDRGGLSSTVQWDFGDGTTRSAGDRVTHSFDEPGTYEVTVEVSDTAGNNDTATRTVEIHEPDEDAPTARAAVEPQPVEAGAPFTLKANDSDDERGIASYAWDLNGDGSGDVGGEQATHSFGSAGTYNVTLTVADGGGNTNTTTVPVEVAPAEAPDIESVSIPERVTAGQQFELAADATDEGRIAEYQWIAGGEVVATGQRATHTISSERTDQFGYQIQLRVVDAAGQANATAPQTITVYPEDNTPPNASLSASTDDTRVDETVTFDASNSTDEPHRAIDTYHWNFDGDNETDRSTDEPVVEHSYDSQGTYNATVTVEDSSGNVDEATVRIEVDPEQQPKRGSGSGGSTSSGPPPVVKEVKQRDGSGATVDVRNARSENSVYASLPDNVAALREHGVDPETPVAMIEKATWEGEATVTATLETIVEARDGAGIEPPAITVVGGVVGVRDRVRGALDRDAVRPNTRDGGAVDAGASESPAVGQDPTGPLAPAAGYGIGALGAAAGALDPAGTDEGGRWVATADPDAYPSRKPTGEHDD